MPNLLVFTVNESSASEVKARIRNLKPNDIKMLALTNLKLNELYKLKHFLKADPAGSHTEHSYNNLADFSNIPLLEEVQNVPVLPKINIVKPELKISNKQLETEIDEEMEAVIEHTDELLHKYVYTVICVLFINIFYCLQCQNNSLSA